MPRYFAIGITAIVIFVVVAKSFHSGVAQETDTEQLASYNSPVKRQSEGYVMATFDALVSQSDQIAMVKVQAVSDEPSNDKGKGCGYLVTGVVEHGLLVPNKGNEIEFRSRKPLSLGGTYLVFLGSKAIHSDIEGLLTRQGEIQEIFEARYPGMARFGSEYCKKDENELVTVSYDLSSNEKITLQLSDSYPGYPRTGSNSQLIGSYIWLTLMPKDLLHKNKFEGDRVWESLEEGHINGVPFRYVVFDAPSFISYLKRELTSIE